MLKEQPNYYYTILKNIILTFIKGARTFGIKISLFNLLGDLSLFYLIKNYKISNYIRKKQHKYVYDFLIDKYSNLIESYKNKKVKIGKNNKKIWCFWWQGVEDAPVLVKKCLKSMEKYSNDYELIIITKDNYKTFANIPIEIIEKLENGTITFTHFSDILRANLLSSHGGIWLDSTMFICDYIFNEFDDMTFNTTSVGDGKWCGFFMGGKPNKIFSFLNDFLIQYNLDYNTLITYFLIDYVIEIAYNSFEECRTLIDNATLRNPNIFYFERNFSNIYTDESFRKICEDSKFFKLSYKISYDKYDGNNNLTNYGYFLDELNL